LTKDTNHVGSNTRGHLQELFASFENISHLKRLLLGAIDKPQRDEMQSAISKIKPYFRNLWTNYKRECFSLRACLVNVVTEPHLDQGDLGWTMSAPLGKFEGAGFCISDLKRCFHFPAGSIAGIRGDKFIHFTRLSTGSRLCLVSTMHKSLLRHVFEESTIRKEDPDSEFLLRN